MSRQIPLTSLKLISDINLTPLMDLTFLLLVTFIITFPLVEQGIPVNLPKGNAQELNPPKAQTVTINRDGEIFLDQASISVAELSATMQQMTVNAPDLTVMVRADEGVSYGQVARVLKVLNDAKITKLALVTQAE